MFVLACGGKVDVGDDAGADAAPPPPPSDASPPPPSIDAAPPTGDCTDLDLVGQEATLELVPEDAPPFAATGGALADGIYQLTSFVDYTGPNGSAGNGGDVEVRIRVTSQTNGWNVEAVTADSDQAVQHSAATATSPATGQLVLAPYCPSASSPTTALYSFDGGVLTLRVSDADEQFTLVTK